ncbi:MAG: molecular chaperone DnaK, partial [Spirochaetia bacterium]|nr:molecular chaperone DnaK [Spirochaetia bacterium]
KAKMETLKQSAYKLAEQMYAANAAKNGGANPGAGAAGAGPNPGAGAQGAGPNPGAGAQGAGPKSGTGDDVDFEVVDDDKK